MASNKSLVMSEHAAERVRLRVPANQWRAMALALQKAEGRVPLHCKWTIRVVLQGETVGYWTGKGRYVTGALSSGMTPYSSDPIIPIRV